MAAPIMPRLKLDTRASNTLLSVGGLVALFAAYYIILGKEPIPADTHVIYEVRTNGQVSFRVDMLASGITRISGTGAPLAEYATPNFAERRVLAAFRSRKFLDLDVSAFPPPVSARICQFGLTANRRKTLLRYDCAAPPAEVKVPLQAFEKAAHFCKAARQTGIACAI